MLGQLRSIGQSVAAPGYIVAHVRGALCSTEALPRAACIVGSGCSNGPSAEEEEAIDETQIVLGGHLAKLATEHAQDASNLRHLTLGLVASRGPQSWSSISSSRGLQPLTNPAASRWIVTSSCSLYRARSYQDDGLDDNEHPRGSRRRDHDRGSYRRSNADVENNNYSKYRRQKDRPYNSNRESPRRDRESGMQGDFGIGDGWGERIVGGSAAASKQQPEADATRPRTNSYEYERKQRAYQESTTWERREEQLRAAKEVTAQLKKAGSWSELNRILTDTPYNHMGPEQVSWALSKYADLILKDTQQRPQQQSQQGRSSSSSSGTTTYVSPEQQQFHTAVNMYGSNSSVSPAVQSPSSYLPFVTYATPPEEVTERLHTLVADTVPFTTMRHLALMLMNLSRVPHSPLSSCQGTAPAVHTPDSSQGSNSRDDNGHNRLNQQSVLHMLLQRLQLLLQPSDGPHATAEGPMGGKSPYYSSSSSSSPSSFERERDWDAPWQIQMVVRQLSMSCVALRRLHVADPLVYRAIAARATPLLESSAAAYLRGEPLAGIILAFSVADNPEPRFMRLALSTATRPGSLTRLRTPYYAASLLNCACRAGLTDPEILNPLADRLVALMESAASSSSGGGSGGDRQQQHREEKEESRGSSSDREEAGDGDEGEETGVAAEEAQATLRPREVAFLLQACAAVGFNSHAALLGALSAEIQRCRSSWPLPWRLQAAQYLLSLGVDLLGAPAGPQQQQQLQQQGGEQGLQQLQATAAAVVTEEEVLGFLGRPELTVGELLTVLLALARLHDNVASSAVRTDTTAAQPTAAAVPTAAIGQRMPTALATAVQLVDAAAPLMRTRALTQALTALAAAGTAAPPSVLARAQQLHDELYGKASKPSAGGTTALAPGVRDMLALCALVGRVLTWQPAAVAAVGLHEDFVRRCRTAAMDAVSSKKG